MAGEDVPARRSTAYAVSPDSGSPWAEQGAWPVAEGLWRIPLPLPEDGLRAVNIYVIETQSGLVLVDGGWAVAEARAVLERSLGQIGYQTSDIRQFLVTHAHRDHYSLASVLSQETGATSMLGAAERPSLDVENFALHASNAPAVLAEFEAALVAVGAPELLKKIMALEESSVTDPRGWHYPTKWLAADQTIALGDRMLDALHTPGHTPGHFVFADQANGLLFAGDHILPTITPSIGFTFPLPASPLADFMSSLAKIRDLPDLQLLPAHGPIAPSTHTRVDELMDFHETRLDQCFTGVSSTGSTAADVARTLPWTRRNRAYADLDVWNQELAAFETKAHLDVLVARGVLAHSVDGGTFIYRAPSSAVPS